MTEIAAYAFDHLPFPAVVVDCLADDSVIIACNRAFADAVGSTREALAGMSVLDLLPGTDFARLAGPDGADRGVEGSLVVTAGPPEPVAISASSLPQSAPVGRAVVVVEKVRARQEAERALRESAKRLEDIVDNVNALIYLKSAADGSYLWINRHYEELAQIRREDIRGKSDFDLWPEDGASVYAANDRAVLAAGVPMEFEEPLRGVESVPGTWLSLKFPLYDEDGTPYAVGGISTDISDRNRAEALIRTAKEEAERANQAKSEFLSRMSHELRTPLNSIIGFGQLLELEHLSPADAESVGHIVEAGRHLLALINEVLEISRIESGRQAMSLEPVDACHPLEEAFELVRPLAAARRIELARDLHAALHRFVRADHQRLKQVLLNVLMNAVKYNHEYGMITVTTEVIDRCLRYRVMDTGTGMSAADVDKIFTPFERLDVNAADIEGTGLGLALSKSLVEAMDGTIGVERTVQGRGTVFFVDMPLTEPVALQHDEALASAPDPPSGRTLESVTVVYIEDNLANLDLVRRILAREGDPTLIPAMQGTVGIELAALHRPDVVLLDLHLPDIDGAEVLQRLQADDRTRDIPVLILSADATQSQIDRLRASGARDYITKPLDVQAFLGAIRAAVGG